MPMLLLRRTTTVLRILPRLNCGSCGTDPSIRMASGRVYTVGIAPEILEGQLGLRPSYYEVNPQFGKKYQKGEPIVRAYADLGDQVFVDKVSYNFACPHRGDIFVFKTNDIPGIGRPDGPSEHFIKRLAGSPE